jgi:ribonuclease D
MSVPAPTAPHITLCHNDLPAGLEFRTGMVAIDTETTGLSLQTDRLCLAQVGDGLGNVWLVKFDGHDYAAPNLRAVLEDPRLTKLFHFARFDLAMLQKWLGVPEIHPVFCTKIASKLTQPGPGKHNLRTLCQQFLGVELDKTEQISNWAADVLTESQMHYAASDVLYLHQLTVILMDKLTEQSLNLIMHNALNFLTSRVDLDLRGYPETDLFSHTGW